MRPWTLISIGLLIWFLIFVIRVSYRQYLKSVGREMEYKTKKKFKEWYDE